MLLPPHLLAVCVFINSHSAAALLKSCGISHTSAVQAHMAMPLPAPAVSCISVPSATEVAPAHNHDVIQAGSHAEPLRAASRSTPADTSTHAAPSQPAATDNSAMLQPSHTPSQAGLSVPVAVKLAGATAAAPKADAVRESAATKGASSGGSPRPVATQAEAPVQTPAALDSESAPPPVASAAKGSAVPQPAASASAAAPSSRVDTRASASLDPASAAPAAPVRAASPPRLSDKARPRMSPATVEAFEPANKPAASIAAHSGTPQPLVTSLALAAFVTWCSGVQLLLVVLRHMLSPTPSPTPSPTCSW